MSETPQSYHVTDVTALWAAAEKVRLDAESAYLAALDQEDRDKASAARDKSGMGDGYWRPAHVARLRYQAARALAEALGDEGAGR